MCLYWSLFPRPPIFPDFPEVPIHTSIVNICLPLWQIARPPTCANVLRPCQVGNVVAIFFSFATWANVVRRGAKEKQSAKRCNAMQIVTWSSWPAMNSMQDERCHVCQRVAACRIPAKLAWLVAMLFSLAPCANVVRRVAKHAMHNRLRIVWPVSRGCSSYTWFPLGFPWQTGISLWG